MLYASNPDNQCSFEFSLEIGIFQSFKDFLKDCIFKKFSKDLFKVMRKSLQLQRLLHFSLYTY